jgi:hypothetical protein
LPQTASNMSIELVEIVVDGQEAQCLLLSASKSSAAWAILRVSMMKWIITGLSAPGVTIECRQDTARDLLRIAELHYHSAAQKIEQMLASRSLLRPTRRIIAPAYLAAPSNGGFNYHKDSKRCGILFVAQP